MSPSAPPVLSSKDFDPATEVLDDDVEMDEEQEESKIELSSVEINILIYLYLLESKFEHAAFSLLNESNLRETALFQHFNPSSTGSDTPTSRNSKPNGTPGPSKASPREATFGSAGGKIPRGELIRKLWKGLRWEEIERHVSANGSTNTHCPRPFHLLIPHICPPAYPSSSKNPALPLPSALQSASPPPKRSEAFPPPEEQPEAGPSRPRKTAKDAATQTVSNVKPPMRRTRAASTASESQAASPSRSLTPALSNKGRREKGQKRVRVSEAPSSDAERVTRGRKVKDKEEDGEEDMELDEVPRKPKRKGAANGIGETPKIRLKVKNTTRRSQSPAESESQAKVARGESWLDEEDIGVFSEHKDFISCLAWNPGNLNVLATGSGDATARLWDFHSDNKHPSRALKSHGNGHSLNHKGIDSGRNSVTCMCWHPDGTVLATGSRDGVGRLFTPSGTLQGVMTYGRGFVNAIKFSPSGSTIITARADFTVCLWIVGNSYNQTMVRCFDSHTKEVNDVDWFDDNVFASAGNDHTIFVFRENDKRPRFTFKGHTDDVTKIAWSPLPDGQEVQNRLLASVSDDGNCMIWRLPSYPEDRGTSSRSISPIKPNANKDGTIDDDYFTGDGALVGIDYCVNRLNVVTESEDRRMHTLQWAPCCKEGKMLLAAGGQDSPVKLFDALSGECLHIFKGLDNGTGALSFSPSAQALLAAGGWDAKFVIWDIDSGAMIREHEIDETQTRQASRDRPMMVCMSWRPDGEQLAIGLFNKTLMTVNVSGLKAIKSDGEKATDEQ